MSIEEEKLHIYVTDIRNRLDRLINHVRMLTARQTITCFDCATELKKYNQIFGEPEDACQVLSTVKKDREDLN
ncbi:MAG: hypothetical protein H8D23_18610 [Candidatus Brocadiales bacterium]|nr:hypothetical protein [Candidatus Brocadiales bacterium]